MGARDSQPPPEEGPEAPDRPAAVQIRQRLTSYRFPQSHRLTRKAELTSVLRRGKRVRTRFLEIRAMPSPLAHPRAGLIIAKGRRRAVDRNRIKRKIREAVRLYLLPVLGRVDFVIRTRDEIYGASDDEFRADLSEAIGQLIEATESAR